MSSLFTFDYLRAIVLCKNIEKDGKSVESVRNSLEIKTINTSKSIIEGQLFCSNSTHDEIATCVYISVI